MAEIDKVAREMEAESKALTKEIYKMCWFMRGGLTAEEAFQLDFTSREIIAEIIQSNLETTKETRLPFF